MKVEKNILVPFLQIIYPESGDRCYPQMLLHFPLKPDNCLHIFEIVLVFLKLIYCMLKFT